MSYEIAGIPDVADAPVSIELNTLVNDQQMNEHKTDAVSHSVDRALSYALDAPGKDAEVMEAREEILKGGKARLEKAAIVMDVEPDTVSVHAKHLETQMDELTDRVRELYMELATWNVAWAVSRRVQQDMSHLLKGQ